MSDEIQKSQELSDFELLKEAIPQWKLASNEPFITTPQSDVTSPAWDGVDIQLRNQRGGDDGGGGNQAGLLAVMGVQQPDGTFAIKVVSFAGTAEDP